MGTYCVLDDEAAEVKVSADVSLVTTRLLEGFPGIVAIALVGSFGRGEGSVLIDDGRTQVINDYDFTLIAQSPLDKGRLERMRPILAAAVGVRQVDLSVILADDLPRLKAKMGNYDLKYASRVVHGDPAVLEWIPPIAPDSLPPIEARVPIFLYLMSLLQSYPSEGALSDDRKFWILQQISKSILGWTTAHLVLGGLYHPSYRQRKEISLRLFGDDPDKASLIEFGYEFKLKPTYRYAADARALWAKAHAAYMAAAYSFFEKYYGQSFQDWLEIAHRSRYDRFVVIRSLISRLRREAWGFHHSEALNRAKLLVCAARIADRIDSRLLTAANIELRKITPDWPLGSSWEAAVKKICEVSPDSKYSYSGGDAVFLQGLRGPRVP